MGIFKGKSTFLTKVLVCIMSVCVLIGTLFSLPLFGQKQVNADAATKPANAIEYQDLLGIEDRTSWGAHDGEYYFGGVTLQPFGYFNSADSVCTTWYAGNTAPIAANNGVDIMEYIYVNGVSARKLIKDNVSGANLANGCGCWLSNPAASPVYVETTNDSGIIIKVLRSFVGDKFTFTFKAGFSLIRNDGQTIYVSDDIHYDCESYINGEGKTAVSLTKAQRATLTFKNENGATVSTKRFTPNTAIGEIPAVPEKAGCIGYWMVNGSKLTAETVLSADATATPVYTVEYQDLLGLEDRTNWASGGHSDIVTFGLMDYSITEGNQYFHAQPSDCWYQGNVAIITANGGVDIMQYVYINGVSARDLLIENETAGKSTANTKTWLSNPAAWPIALETGADVWIRLDKTKFGDNFTFTIKAGFSLIRSDGQTIYVSDDINYDCESYSNGDGTYGCRLTREQKYTLTFENENGETVSTKRIVAGNTLGEIPEPPQKDGYVAKWTIDGTVVTADTVYGYGENKTATVEYFKEQDITATIGLSDWGVPETESDLRYLWILEGTQLKSYPNSYWNDHAENKDGNYGVDIMEYIYIDGESVRSIVMKNKSGETNYVGTVTAPLTWGSWYAPIIIETVSNGVCFKVLTAYKTSFTVTFKAGFTLETADGTRLYVSEDVTYKVGATMGDIRKLDGYTVTFDPNNGEAVTTVKAAIGGTVERPADPVKAATEAYVYTFNGWYHGDELFDFATPITEDITLTAEYTETENQSFTVIFNAGNGETVAEKVYANTCVSRPEDPIKAATNSKKYAFLGWYNGETKFDFTTPITEDTTLVAKYQDIALISLSDLYDESNANTTGAFKTGEVTIEDLEPQVGVNNNEAFELSFEFSFQSSIEDWATFEIKMATNGVDATKHDAQFYLGWRFYLRRPNQANECFEYLQYDPNNFVGDVNEPRVSLGAFTTDKTTAFAAGTVYEVKVGYRLIAAATGTVELWVTIGDYTNTQEFVLGADYYNTYYKNINSLICFTVPQAKEVTLANVGQTGKPAFEATFVGANGVVSGLTQINNQVVLPSLEAETVTVTPEGNLTETTIKKVLLGWTTDAVFGVNSPLYPVGYKLSSTDGDKTLYAVFIEFALDEGAGVRTAQDNPGLRFRVFVNGTELVNEAYRIQSIGTLIAPTDYIAKAGAFTHDALGDGNFVDRAQEKWADEAGVYNEYTAALIGIDVSQYARAFSARGYLKVQYTDGTVGYVYTDYVEAEHSRSIYDVATAAFKDESENYYKNPVVQNYVNSVADLSWETVAQGIVKNTNAVGAYELNSVTQNEATFTVSATDGVGALKMNGVRLVKNKAVNVAIGGVVYALTLQAVENGSFQFTIGATNDLGNKQSAETLYFASSDEDLDFFLNDYFKRHTGYTEDGVNLAVNSATAGVSSEEFFSHEWMTRSYYWFNSFDGFGGGEDRIEGMRKFLSNVPVDDYGYVWSSNDRVREPNTEVSTGEQKMGWPFPNNDTVKTAHWEFNGDDSGNWSSNISASNSGGLYGATVSGRTSNITFSSNSFSSWTSKKIYTYYAPLLEFEVRIDDATNVEDIYVWYTTSASTSFSEDKKVSVNEKAFIKYDYNGKYEHVLYLPMYAESAWGESTSTYVKQLKIEIALKSGKSISGKVALNYVRPTLDTRMSNNNSILISSLRQDYDYTGDLDYLTENITRARKAMNFLMQMYDSTRGLKKESYLVGHGGTKEDLNWLTGNATTESIASSISQGYWDILYMPEYDFQSNVYFYKAVADMAYLESVLADKGITVDTAAATVKTATRNRTTGTSAYSYDLDSVANTVLTNLRQTTENTNHTGFWNASEGRFVAGYASGENKWYDYGYVVWNLEAIYYGIATDEQAAAIMDWLATEEDLYKWEFAPTSNTVTGDAGMLNGEYEAKGNKWVNCQFGGAIMYSSFFDLMARIQVNGADDAYARLQAIQEWYQEIYDYYMANGEDPYDFYRYYYDDKGIQLQGLGTNGEIGIDREFLESFLPVSAVAYGFFGIESINADTLQITPNLPTELSYWGAENLAFNFVKYDLVATKNSVQITSVRGDTAGLNMLITLDCAAGQSVYVNGVKQNVSPVNGKVSVTVAFGAVVVEVR